MVWTRDERGGSDRLGIVLHPSITINNITFRGELEGEYIFKAICAGFYVSPEICKGDNIDKIINESSLEDILAKGRSGIRLNHIILAITVILGLNLLVLYGYR